ncbi:GPS motif protein, partial [Trinorchestia longiramus]
IMYIPVAQSEDNAPTVVRDPGEKRKFLLSTHRLYPPGPRVGILLEFYPGKPPSSLTNSSSNSNSTTQLQVVEEDSGQAQSSALEDGDEDEEEEEETDPYEKAEMVESEKTKLMEINSVEEEDDFGEDIWVLTWGTQAPNNYSTPDQYFLLPGSSWIRNRETGFYELFLSSEWLNKTMPQEYEGDFVSEYVLGVAKVNVTAVAEFYTEYGDYLLDEEEITTTNITQALLSLRSSAFNDTLALLLPVGEDYALRTAISSCLFFDKASLSWSSQGCRVAHGNASTTICACNHLTSFGSGFIPMPNPIDFSYVFANAGFAENLTIYLTIIFSLSFYIIGLIYA